MMNNKISNYKEKNMEDIHKGQEESYRNNYQDNYEQNYQIESEYLEKTIKTIKKELEKLNESLTDREKDLIASRKDMWENSGHSSLDFDKLTEMNNYLQEVKSQTRSYTDTAAQIKKYSKILKSPYFGRFDFIEDNFIDEYKCSNQDENDCSEREKIYIGLHSVINSNNHEILVYDWRAPISSIFYQHELGKASYKAPIGIIEGRVLLKRQYKIFDSKLKYYFDCSVKIDDEVLQEVLYKNSSDKMRNIVETIQRDQDIIIRDTDNELLIVQGVAGSGKTSIAMHRIAFLLYQELNSQLTSKNMIIISPNEIFSQYISNVLPELGEENVNQIAFPDYTGKELKRKGNVQTKNQYLEALISYQDSKNADLKKQSSDFKGSHIFVEILNRFVKYYEYRLLAFDDVYYNGLTIKTKQQLKNIFLDNKINRPAAERLKRIENIILEAIRPLQKERILKIENVVENHGGHEFEEKGFARLLSMKEFKLFSNRIKKFTEIDYYTVYKLLFKEKELFIKLSQGLELPENIAQIIEFSANNLEKNIINYEDCAPLLYLKLKLEGSNKFSDIKHVVIDEAQDYSPMHFEIFKILFKDANYTILGDINQSIDKEIEQSFYEAIDKILNKDKSLIVALNKSYRSSFEICTFNQRLLNKKQDIVSFERHEAEPKLIVKDTEDELYERIIMDGKAHMEEGYKSIAIICKTSKEAKNVYINLKKVHRKTSVKLIDYNSDEIQQGIIVIPAYMSKGLEFDVVFVFNASCDNYHTELDRRLLYIACTRALHRLVFYCNGKSSIFLNNDSNLKT